MRDDELFDKRTQEKKDEEKLLADFKDRVTKRPINLRSIVWLSGGAITSYAVYQIFGLGFGLLGLGLFLLFTAIISD